MYKKIEPVLLPIDELADQCGFFNADTDLNSGYGCRSRSKLKDESGKCYAWDCPLAYLADLEDFKKLDDDLYQEYKKHKDDIIFPNHEWVVQYRKAILNNGK